MTKIKDVFSFLKNYNELLNPITSDIDRQIWSYNLLNLPEIKELYSIFASKDLNKSEILEIERPKLDLCPCPDGRIIPWIVEDWTSLNIDNVSYRESIVNEIVDDDGRIVEEEEFFLDDKTRVEIFETWLEERAAWLDSQRPKKAGLDLYNRLFKLYSDIKREPESVELILGDGNIAWTTGDRKIDHPVLFQKVKLEFDVDKPSFIVRCEELKTELYTGMLRIIPSINQTMIPELIKEAEDIEHIADRENNIGFFKRLIYVIDEEGEYIEDYSVKSENPTISYKPTLFLRKRNLGYSIFIDRIIDYIDKNGDEASPDFFKTMVGDFDDKREVHSELDDLNENGIDKDVLLTLSANKEQLKIIKYLENYGEVLVQGPPGTGKTHTIANLIGHLLSQGKNVLVTSHTEKALTVLKDMVIEELQSLCISLLSTNSQKGDIDATLFEIDEMNTSLDLDESEEKIAELQEQRKELIDSLKEKNKELIEVRSLDYKDIVFQNESISPIDAAKFINKYKDNYNYIPGVSKDDRATINLTDDELEFLYRSNGLMDLLEEDILGNEAVSFGDLPSLDKVEGYMDDYYTYTSSVKDFIPSLIFHEELDILAVRKFLDRAKTMKDEVDNLDDFQKDILVKMVRDDMVEEFWKELFREYDLTKEEYPEYSRVIFNHNYSISDSLISKDSLWVLENIVSSGKDKPVGFISSIIRPDWKILQDSINKENSKIEKLEDFKNIRTIVSYRLKKKDILEKIEKLLGEDLDAFTIEENDFENGVDLLLNRIKKLVKLYGEDWASYKDEMEKYISNLDDYYEMTSLDIEEPLKSMKSILESLFKRELEQKHYSLLLEETIAKLDGLGSQLADFRDCGEIFDKLYLAIENRNKERYRIFYKKIEEIYGKKEIYKRRVELLLKIREISPDWESAIVSREGIHGQDRVPENIHLAWKWSQLNKQLNRINSYDLNIIQKELDEINGDIMKNSKALAYEKAWYHKVKNTTKEQTQAIQGWRQTIMQIGKGTGKSAPMLLKKARDLMPLCQTAIPVWIMPLNKVAENFQPEKNKFDLVIIDEASQADILALSALYLGKQIIVVGDDAQVSPSPLGIKTSEMNALIDQYLQDIPLNHLFNASTSVYDMAKTSGFKSLMLTEHFRCLPEIIEFSNELSYNDKIKPLRDDSGVSVRPALVPYRVEDGYRDSNKVNRSEAEHIASSICACIEMKEYKGKTIGVISLLGEEQAYEIDRLLQLYLDPKEYESREILCGSSAQFQGDERDIIFLSLVESPSEDGGPVRLVSESGRNDMYRKRYNVAASRAKDQMWVVHSLNPEKDLKPEDLRLKLIKHAMNPKSVEQENKLTSAESDFERRVIKALLNKGYRVYPQWKVGAYRMDMVVEDKNKRIVVECDGERYHSPENLGEDMRRQAILERLGWRFIRIRGSVFYKDPEKTMNWLFKELENYHIRPSFLNIEEREGEIEEESSLLDRVKVKAENIRRGMKSIENNQDLLNR